VRKTVDRATPNRRMRIAVPNKGRLHDPTVDLLERADRLLGEFGLESRQVTPPTETASKDRSLAEFVAGDTEANHDRDWPIPAYIALIIALPPTDETATHDGLGIAVELVGVEPIIRLCPVLNYDTPTLFEL